MARAAVPLRRCAHPGAGDCSIRDHANASSRFSMNKAGSSANRLFADAMTSPRFLKARRFLWALKHSMTAIRGGRLGTASMSNSTTDGFAVRSDQRRSPKFVSLKPGWKPKRSPSTRESSATPRPCWTTTRIGSSWMTLASQPMSSTPPVGKWTCLAPSDRITKW